MSLPPQICAIQTVVVCIVVALSKLRSSGSRKGTLSVKIVIGLAVLVVGYGPIEFVGVGAGVVCESIFEVQTYPRLTVEI
jgi:hypothetical protein